MTGGRFGLGAALACLLLLPVACGSSGPPIYGEVFGGFDYPCALGMSPLETAQPCTAHVTLVNHGGEGIGHVTLEVQVKDARGSSPASVVTCGAPVPDLPPEGHIDLVCEFELPAGKVVAGIPDVKSVDYLAATPQSSSGFDFSGAALLVLGGATFLLALAILIAAIRRPGAAIGAVQEPAAETGEAPVVAAGQAAVDADPERTEEVSAAIKPRKTLPSAAGPSRRKADRPDDIDDEYDLPPLPR